MRLRTGAVTLRTQFALIVVAGAILPLGLVALWLASTGMRSGEALLRRHLDQSADQIIAAVSGRWEFRRSDLLLLADNDVTARVLTRGAVTRSDSLFLSRLVAQVGHGIPSVEILDRQGRRVWHNESDSRGPDASQVTAPPATRSEPTFAVLEPIHDRDGAPLGTVAATVLLSSVVPADQARPVVPGARLGVRLSSSNQVLMPLDPQSAFPLDGRLMVAHEPWLVVVRSIREPGLDLALGAPLASYVGPFEEAGRLGMLALIVVTVSVLGLTLWLTTRVTRPIEQLGEAADAVSRGELHRRVDARGPAELRRLGNAFNVMTDSLGATLDQLSRRSAMAAVGEFASALSHDVRNALTAIKVDIERTLLRPMEEARGSAVLGRALNNVKRLESLVSGSLRVARRGHLALIQIDLRKPAIAAADVVVGAFTAVPATLRVEVPDDPVLVNGDPGSLEQLLANVLFNSAQSLAPSGAAAIRVIDDGESAAVEISDNGCGMSEDQIASLERPFYSSKASGTGLGLPIARQIAAAHGGSLSIVSRPGEGTTVRLQLAAVRQQAMAN